MKSVFRYVILIMLVVVFGLRIIACATNLTTKDDDKDVWNSGEQNEVSGDDADDDRNEDGENMVDNRTGLRVLAIGNSFSWDALTYLPAIAKELGKKEIIIANLYIGGCSIETHYNNALFNNNVYEFQIFDEEGKMTAEYHKSLRYGLEYGDWDYISLQQSSDMSGIAESYKEDQINSIVKYVKRYAPNTQLAWHSTWAYQSDSNHKSFPLYDNNQLVMFERINEAVKTKILTIKAFERIISNTTAIQNARTSYIGDTLTRDGYHLSLKEGRYIAGLMFCKALTNASITGLTHIQNGFKDMDTSFIKMAVESVENAYKKPYETTQSKYIV